MKFTREANSKLTLAKKYWHTRQVPGIWVFLKCLTQFSIFSSKNICHYSKRAQTLNLLYKRPWCYHGASKTHVWDKIFQCSIYKIPWIHWIFLPFRKTPLTSQTSTCKKSSNTHRWWWQPINLIHSILFVVWVGCVVPLYDNTLDPRWRPYDFQTNAPLIFINTCLSKRDRLSLIYFETYCWLYLLITQMNCRQLITKHQQSVEGNVFHHHVSCLSVHREVGFLYRAPALTLYLHKATVSEVSSS